MFNQISLTTVKELIEKLQKFPKDKYVFIENEQVHFKKLEVSGKKLMSPLSRSNGKIDFIVVSKAEKKL